MTPTLPQKCQRQIFCIFTAFNINMKFEYNIGTYFYLYQQYSHSGWSDGLQGIGHGVELIIFSHGIEPTKLFGSTFLWVGNGLVLENLSQV